MSEELEEGRSAQVDFDKLASVAATGQRVVPVVVQHAETLQVLLIGYANHVAVQTSIDEGIAVFWSTSRNELWRKGATSGDVLELREVRVNCEQNSLLYLVVPVREGVCHTKGADGVARSTCYYRRLDSLDALEFVDLQGTRRHDA